MLRGPLCEYLRAHPERNLKKRQTAQTVSYLLYSMNLPSSLDSSRLTPGLVFCAVGLLSPITNPQRFVSTHHVPQFSLTRHCLFMTLTYQGPSHAGNPLLLLCAAWKQGPLVSAAPRAAVRWLGAESTQALPRALRQEMGGVWLAPVRPCWVWGWRLGLPASDEVAPDDLQCSLQH